MILDHKLYSFRKCGFVCFCLFVLFVVVFKNVINVAAAKLLLQQLLLLEEEKEKKKRR